MSKCTLFLHYKKFFFAAGWGVGGRIISKVLVFMDTFLRPTFPSSDVPVSNDPNPIQFQTFILTLTGLSDWINHTAGSIALLQQWPNGDFKKTPCTKMYFLLDYF